MGSKREPRPPKLTEFEPGHGFSREDWDDVSDSPEITREEMAKMRPFREVMTEIAAREAAKLKGE